MDTTEKVKSRWTRSFFTALNTRGNEERYICDICQRDFASPSSLALHSQVHVLERKFKCEPCQVSFHSQGHLQKHRRSTAHETRVEMTQAFGIPTSDNPRPYGCPECDTAFRKHGHLAKHLRSKSHITRLESHGLIPTGTYAALEKSGQELKDKLVTINCEQSLHSLRQIAAHLFHFQPLPPTTTTTNHDHLSCPNMGNITTNNNNSNHNNNNNNHNGNNDSSPLELSNSNSSLNGRPQPSAGHLSQQQSSSSSIAAHHHPGSQGLFTTQQAEPTASMSPALAAIRLQPSHHQLPVTVPSSDMMLASQLPASMIAASHQQQHHHRHHNNHNHHHHSHQIHRAQQQHALGLGASMTTDEQHQAMMMNLLPHQVHHPGIQASSSIDYTLPLPPPPAAVPQIPPLAPSLSPAEMSAAMRLPLANDQYSHLGINSPPHHPHPPDSCKLHLQANYNQAHSQQQQPQMSVPTFPSYGNTPLLHMPMSMPLTSTSSSSHLGYGSAGGGGMSVNSTVCPTTTGLSYMRQ